MEYCDEHACLSVCLSVCLPIHTHISGTTCPYSTEVLSKWPRLIVFWWHFNTFCSPGFMDFIAFGLYDDVGLQRQSRCSVVHELTPLQCGTGSVLSWTTVCANTRRVLRARGTGAEFALHHCVVVTCSVGRCGAYEMWHILFADCYLRRRRRLSFWCSLFVCLSVCLSVCRITRKLVNGFWRNFLEG